MVIPAIHQWKISLLAFLLCLSYTQGTRYSKHSTKQLVRAALINIDLRKQLQDIDFYRQLFSKTYAQFSRGF